MSHLPHSTLTQALDQCGSNPSVAGAPTVSPSPAVAFLTIVAVTCTVGYADARSDLFETIRQARLGRVERLMRRTLDPPEGTTFGAFPERVDLQFAMACLWLGERLAEGNEAVRRAYAKVIEGTNEVPASSGMTPNLAYTQKWRFMRLWLRLYSFYGDKGIRHPRRLDADAQAKMLDLFWHYAAKTSTIHRARPEFIWHIQGSENHDMMDLGNALLCVQALKGAPNYRDRQLPDGHTPGEHYKAWNAYYKLYADERARHRLFVEISPTYGKYFLPELMNIGDLAEDPLLRRKIHMLLTLTFADWAVDQVGGIRGGGKTRSYQGNYSRKGLADSWNRMIRTFLDTAGGWETDDYVNYTHNYNFILGTSFYRMPDVVMDLALSPAARGCYTYTSVRPAASAPKPRNAGPLEGYWMDAENPRCLRTSYVTPDYVLGGFMLDPAADYASIHSQNRWSGIVFATGPDARVYPQCVGLRNGKTYNQHWAIQHRNVLIVQKNRTAKQAGDMRVYFAPGMRKRLTELDGWAALREGAAYVAVRPLSRSADANRPGYTWDDGTWLRCTDAFTPVILVAGRRHRHPTLDAFLEYLQSFRVTVRGGTLSCTFADAAGAETTLTMDVGKQKNLPTVNGHTIDLDPERTFDCPYLYSQRGSGVVTIKFRGRTLVLDFNRTLRRER